jgi:hypothetical protein
MHEDLHRTEQTKRSSDRSFGRVMAAAFLVIGVLPMVHEPYQPRWWALAIAVIFAAVTQWRPAALAPLNYVWLKFGLALHKIVSPVILALLFYTTVLPIGLLMRAFGKDPLRLKRDPSADSYWIVRNPPGPPPESMSQQF